ncbi:MAG: uracil-DNA glycosylase [Mariprofundales bacterium]
MPDKYLQALQEESSEEEKDKVELVPNLDRLNNVDTATAIATDMRAVAEQAQDCTRCALHEMRQNIVFGKGNTDAPLLIIGEGAGQDEDVQGIPFVGRAGQLLDKILHEAGMTLEDIYIINIIKCHPPQNRNPAAEEITACNHWLKQQLQYLKPRCVLLLGKVAAHHVLDVDTKTTLKSLREQWHTMALDNIPTTMSQVPVRVSYHPSYLLRSPVNKGKAWQDWLQVIQYLNNQLK